MSISMGSLLLGGTALLGGSSYFAYRYARAHTELRESMDETPVTAADSFRVFDQLADKYDDAIGQEEAALWYGLMRWDLLKKAQGDVLEVSAGTGRNFKYYKLDDGRVRSLTFTDLSPHMLVRAEDKFFDKLGIGPSHPDVRVTFCLADAHCLADPKVPLRKPPAPPPAPAKPALRRRPLVAVPPVAPSELGSQEPGGEPYSPPWWAYWRRLPPPPDPEATGDQSPAGPAPAAVQQQPGTASSQAAPLAEEDMKDMPGLHPSGLLNLFRVFAPSGGSSTGSSKVRARSEADMQPTADNNAASAPASQPMASPPGQSQQPAKAPHSQVPASPRQPAKAPHGHDACEPCCTATACATGAYSERCTSGKLPSGAPLHRFAPEQFDTVVDTFGLCSHEDPVQALREMARVCKRDGKILLLQHGRSHYSWLNDKLDASAADHQRKWGCLWNRDILEIVQEAGLQTEHVTRWHFGTSYSIVARPPPTPQ